MLKTRRGYFDERIFEIGFKEMEFLIRMGYAAVGDYGDLQNGERITVMLLRQRIYIRVPAIRAHCKVVELEGKQYLMAWRPKGPAAQER